MRWAAASRIRALVAAQWPAAARAMRRVRSVRQHRVDYTDADLAGNARAAGDAWASMLPGTRCKPGISDYARATALLPNLRHDHDFDGRRIAWYDSSTGRGSLPRRPPCSGGCIAAQRHGRGIATPPTRPTERLNQSSVRRPCSREDVRALATPPTRPLRRPHD